MRKVGRRRVGNGMQNDPEYRALEKQRRREFAQDNPDYREKRTGVYARVAKTEEGGRGIVFSFQFSVGNRAYKALPQESSLLPKSR